MARIPDFGGAFGDLMLFLRTRERHEFVFALMAIAFTGFVIFAFGKDSYFERAPQITYMDLLPPGRTDAEIAAENLARSKARHAAEAERRRQFRQLADQMGIEVDKPAPAPKPPAPQASAASASASTGAENRKP